MTPTEAITALEKALEAGPSDIADAIAWLKSGEAMMGPRTEKAVSVLLDAHAGALRDAAHWKAEYEKRLRVSIMQGDVIANHVIAMQSAVLEQHYGEGSIEAMNWVKNTLAGPGFMPGVEEAEAIPDPEAEGIAQAWFNAKTAEHEAFRAANPGPAALATNTKAQP